MNQVFVSIIIPVYNVEDYIISCLESVVNQDFKGMIECILIDDCGMDNSISIAKDYINKKQKNNIKFKIIHNKRNLGLSVSRNLGILNSVGEYIYFLDSDDSITQNCISLFFELINKYPKADLIQGGCISILNNGTEWNGQSSFDFEKNNLPNYVENITWIKEYMLSSQFPVTAWNKFIKREFIIKHDLYFLPDIIHEDQLWNFMLAKYVKKIAFLNKNTLIHIINPNGIMATSSGKNKSFNSWCIIWSNMIDNLDNENNIFHIKKILRSTLSWYLFNSSVEMRKKIKIELYKLIRYVPKQLRNSFYIYYYLPNIILRRPFMYRYFLRKFS